MKEHLPLEKGWNYHPVVWPIVAFTTFFIIWASFSEVDELVKGSGTVVPFSQKKVLQHLEGGIVEKIYVQEGERVKAGDPIYKLKNTTFTSDTKEKEITLEALKIRKARLEAQIAFAKRFDYDTNATEALANECKIFAAAMQNYREQKRILEGEITENRLEKKRKIEKRKNLRAQLDTQKENVLIMRKLVEKGAASKKQYLAEVSKSQALITEINEIKNAIPIIDQKIKSAVTKEKKLKSEKREAWLKELNEVILKIDRLKQKEVAGKDREARKIITSPVDGIIQKLYFHTIGGIVKPGDRVAEITPVDDQLIIEAKIKASDRGNIVIGQPVTISVTAYSYTKYGLLKGKVISISPDSIVDRNGEVYYLVRVRAEHYAFAPDKPILPGMVANVNIKTGKKTVMRYLLKPLKDISQNALTEK